MNKPYVFFEPFAGSAAVTYGLLGSKSPISYMGSKSGFFLPIVGVMGLSTSHPPSAIVLGEPGPWAAVHACLAGAVGVSAEEVARWVSCGRMSYKQGVPESGYAASRMEDGYFKADGSKNYPCTIESPSDLMEVLSVPAKVVADTIRQWKDEEPRALWTRLKQEGWASLLNEGEGRWLGPVSIDDVARFLHANALSMVKNGLATGYSRVNGEGNDFTDRHGAEGHWHATTPEVTAKRIEDVAKFLVCAGTSYRIGDPDSGYNRTEGEGHDVTDTHGAVRPWMERQRIDATPRFPPTAVWQGKAEDIPLPEDMSSWQILMDPPYQNTTKYPHGDCSRETVLRLAQEWSRRGAIVAICEAVSLKNDLGDGWFDVRIDHARKGSVRTFSKQKDEWVTINRVPQYVPPKQVGLFGQ